MANELTKINPETMAATVQSLPQITAWIQSQHDKGIAAGQALVDTIQANGGKITAELYEQVGIYIEKAKRCKALMNEKRSPVTQLMDSYRSVFTSMENDMDVTKAESIPGKLQAYRNRYAAEVERKRLEEVRKAQEASMRTQALERYKQAVLGEFTNKVQGMINAQSGYVKNAYDNCTLENYEEVLAYIKDVPEHFTLEMMVGQLCMKNGSAVPLPQGFPEDFNFVEVRMKVYNENAGALDALYTDTIRKTKTNYLECLPKKKEALELAKTDAEAAKARAAEIKAHEEAEARRVALEQQEAAAKAKQEADIKAQQAQAMALFGGMEQTNVQQTVKTKTKKVVKVASKNGFLALLNFWWVNEGQNLELEDLQKTFKKMITFAEKRANAKDPEFVQGEGIAYEDEITAK